MTKHATTTTTDCPHGLGKFCPHCRGDAQRRASKRAADATLERTSATVVLGKAAIPLATNLRKDGTPTLRLVGPESANGRPANGLRLDQDLQQAAFPASGRAALRAELQGLRKAALVALAESEGVTVRASWTAARIADALADARAARRTTDVVPVPDVASVELRKGKGKVTTVRVPLRVIDSPTSAGREGREVAELDGRPVTVHVRVALQRSGAWYVTALVTPGDALREARVKREAREREREATAGLVTIR